MVFSFNSLEFTFAPRSIQAELRVCGVSRRRILRLSALWHTHLACTPTNSCSIPSVTTTIANYLGQTNRLLPADDFHKLAEKDLVFFHDGYVFGNGFTLVLFGVSLPLLPHVRHYGLHLGFVWDLMIQTHFFALL